MSERNWSVRVAIIGALAALTITALGTGFYGGALFAGPPQADRQQPDQASQTQASTAIQGPSVEQADEPAHLYEPCDEGQEERSSDLCAQWKVADSARSAANAAWLFGALGSLIGAFTLAAASAAAFFAKQAADHTKTAAGHAKDSNTHNTESAERQDRAYLLVAPLGVRNLIGSHDCIGHVLLRNVGATPAFNVSLKVKMTLSDNKELSFFDVPQDPINVERALQPGGEMAQGAMKPFVSVSQLIGGGKYIYVWGVAFYDDIFGKRHFTKFCHRYDSGSRDQANVTEVQRSGIKGPREAHVIIEGKKARHHYYGNDAN